MGDGVIRGGPRTWGAAAIGTLAVAVGCASGPGVSNRSAGRSADDGSNGVIHVLRKKETLYGLSRRYGVPVDTLVRANSVKDPSKLQIGQEIWIPAAGDDGSGGRGSNDRMTARYSKPRNGSIGSSGPASKGPRFERPIDGRLSSLFGWRNGRRHEGIDIPAKRGTPIRAAAPGRVIHSGGGLGDYGKVVIIKHEGHFSTVYAHNKRVRVRRGQFVERGDVIGEVGTTGNASGPHVHFEVRRNRKPVDPMRFLE